MKAIENKLKKYSATQLVAKLEKGNLSEVETSVIIEILKKRGQDVSKWVTEETVETIVEEVKVEKIEKITTVDLSVLAEEVDEFVDTLIEDHHDGVYNEVMKALGGTFESDLDDLLEVATESQLKEALSFKSIKPKKEVVKTQEKKSVEKVEKPKKEKTGKSVDLKESEGLKTKKLNNFTGDNNFKIGSLICFDVSEKQLQGEIKRFFVCHKTNKEKCRIKAENGKIYFKTINNIKLKE